MPDLNHLETDRADLVRRQGSLIWHHMHPIWYSRDCKRHRIAATVVDIGHCRFGLVFKLRHSKAVREPTKFVAVYVEFPFQELT